MTPVGAVAKEATNKRGATEVRHVLPAECTQRMSMATNLHRHAWIGLELCVQGTERGGAVLPAAGEVYIHQTIGLHKRQHGKLNRLLCAQAGSEQPQDQQTDGPTIHCEQYALSHPIPQACAGGKLALAFRHEILGLADFQPSVSDVHFRSTQGYCTMKRRCPTTPCRPAHHPKGATVKTVKDWEPNVAGVLALFEEHMYGARPADLPS